MVRPTSVPDSAAPTYRAAAQSELNIPIAPISVRISTAVKMTGIGRTKLYELIQEGKIDVVKIGTATLIPISSLNRLLEENRRR